jgi:hypothetical protein
MGVSNPRAEIIKPSSVHPRAAGLKIGVVGFRHKRDRLQTAFGAEGWVAIDSGIGDANEVERHSTDRHCHIRNRIFGFGRLFMDVGSGQIIHTRHAWAYLL